MAHFVGRDGREHELPKLTLALSRKMDAGDRVGEARWRSMLTFLTEALPPDLLERELDGMRLEDVDLSALEATYAAVEAGYRADAVAASMRTLEALDLDRLVRVADAVGRMDRQGFRRVV